MANNNERLTSDPYQVIKTNNYLQKTKYQIMSIQYRSRPLSFGDFFSHLPIFSYFQTVWSLHRNVKSNCQIINLQFWSLHLFMTLHPNQSKMCFVVDIFVAKFIKIIRLLLLPSIFQNQIRTATAEWIQIFITIEILFQN